MPLVASRAARMVRVVVALDGHGQFEFRLAPSTTVKWIKEQLVSLTGVQLVAQRLLYGGRELRNNENANDCRFRAGAELSLIPRPSGWDASTRAVVPFGPAPCSAASRDMLNLLQRELLANRVVFEFETSGTSGTYFVHVREARLAVFKPFDEEAFAPANPHTLTGPLGAPGFRAGIRSGTGLWREVAAYLLYERMSASLPELIRSCFRVPDTCVVELVHPFFERAHERAARGLSCHASASSLSGVESPACASPRRLKPVASPRASARSPRFELGGGESAAAGLDVSDPGSTSLTKIGSLQAFEAGCLTDVGFGLFTADQVHLLGLLDVRIVNLDRNSTNILARKTSPRDKKASVLIAIDHALCLPETLEIHEGEEYWSWFSSAKQAASPFGHELVACVAAIDIDSDVRFLRDQCMITPPALRVFAICNTWLKRAVAAGLTLHQLAGPMLRRFDEPGVESLLEQLVAHARLLTAVAQRKAAAAAGDIGDGVDDGNEGGDEADGADDGGAGGPGHTGGDGDFLYRLGMSDADPSAPLAGVSARLGVPVAMVSKADSFWHFLNLLLDAMARLLQSHLLDALSLSLVAKACELHELPPDAYA